MAEVTTNSQHLTSLDLDISSIATNLKTIETQIATTVKEIQNNPKYKIDVGIKTDSSNLDTTAIKKVDDSIKNIGTTTTKTHGITENFLQTIADKARWLSAFYLIQMVQQGFFALVETVKETEDAVIELQRVLNDTSLGDTTIQTELYDIAQAYGRSFEEVSDSAVKFAQTGASFNESLQLTEATMLAVNTAELEVETATTGLIAVMSQFKMESSDMVDIIDKINITADNYAVTSEKIVSALQRFGSASNQANISLEQSIALITAMSEATGRSGETMGTAINSLLVYTQRDSALDVFKNLSDGMSNLVAQYRNGTASIIDVWVELSKTLENKQGAIEQLSAGVANTSDWEQFASSIENDAQELVDEVEQVYGTAGTHRQNYLVAILNNMETYSESLKTMLEDSEGYSLSENEKAMETLTRQYQSLIESVKALAVEFGNAGFLDALKTFVQLGIGATKLIDNLGGLKTVLLALTTVIINMKIGIVSTFFTSLISLIPTAIASIYNFGVAFAKTTASVATGSLSMKNGITYLFGSMKSFATIGIGVVVTALSYYNAKMEEAKQETKAFASALSDEVSELSELRKQYESIAGMTEKEAIDSENLDAIKKTLIETYGIEEEALKSLNGVRAETLELLSAETEKAYKEMIGESSKEMEQAMKDMEKIELTSVFGISDEQLVADGKNIVDGLKEISDEYDNLSFKLDAGMGTFTIEGDGTEQIRENINSLITELTKGGEELGFFETTLLNQLYIMSDESVRLIDESSSNYENFMNVQTEYFKSVYAERAQEIASLDSAMEKQRAYQEIINEMKEYTGTYGETISEIIRWIIELGEASSEEIEGNIAKQLGYDAEKAQESIEALSSAIDGVQSSFSTINEAMGEYNTTGTLSIDMVQQLMSLSGEYASALTFENGQLSYVNQTTGEVINSKQKLIESYIQESTMAQIVSLAEYYLAEQQKETQIQAENSAIASDSLASALNGIVIEALNGTKSLYSLNNALNEFAGGYGLEGDYLSGFITGSNQIISNAQNMYAQIGSIANDTSTWGSDGINSVNEQAKEANEARIDELKAQQDAIKERYNAEIDALKKVKEQNDRIIDQEEYLKKLREAKKDLASAESRSGVEYREDEENAREEINEINKDWQDQLTEWSIDDKIAELEALRDAEVAQVQVTIDALQKATSEMSTSSVSSVSNAMSGMSDAYSGTITGTSKETQELAYETMTNIAQATFDTYADAFLAPIREEYYGIFYDSLDVTSNVFDIMYQNFNNSFVSKAKIDLDALFFQYASKIASFSTLSGGSLSGNTNTYNNSSKSMNNYMNISNSSSASSVYRIMNDMYN